MSVTKVLWVEEEVHNYMAFYLDYLENCDTVEITIVSYPSIALKMTRNQKFDVILIDILLPSRNSVKKKTGDQLALEILEEMSAKGEEVKIGILTNEVKASLKKLSDKNFNFENFRLKKDVPDGESLLNFIENIKPWIQVRG